MRHKILYLTTAIILGLAAIWPISKTGSWYPMHDSTHLARILLIREAWDSGQFPAIWASHINSGLGYPLFHFYAPLFHTLSTFLLGLTSVPTTALKLSIWLTASLGAYGVMRLVGRWGRVAAIVAGLAFALSPYMAVSLYVRGSFSEYLSLALLPCVFLLTEKIKGVRGVVCAALSLTLFILSHNLIPILALPMIVVWMVYHNYKSPKLLLGSIVLAIAASAWFVVPLLFERDFTIADQVARTTSYSLHFVEPWQMWNSVWGYGGSAPGVEDGMSFKLGKIQIILGLLGVGIALVKKNRSLSLMSLFLAVSVWLTTSYSKFLWDMSSTLQIVQFPWRALGLIALYLAIFTGYFVSRISFRPFRLLAGLVIVISLIFLNHKYFAPQTIFTTTVDQPDFSLDELDDISKVVPEFQPKWLKLDGVELPEDRSVFIYLPDSVDFAQDSEMLSGAGPKQGYHYDLVASTSAQVSFGAAYYPTWKGEIDHTKVLLEPDEHGLVSLTIPAGQHSIDIYQSHTRLEDITLAISTITLALMIGLYVKN
jgi:uncharacterized membrane protein